MKKYVLRRLNFVHQDNIEPLGTKEKFWFTFSEKDKDNEPYLFKFSRENTGEHWSEKVAEQLCLILAIPHVIYDLALCKRGNRFETGIYTKNIVPKNYRMIMGNEVLYQYQPTAYPKPEQNINRFCHIHEHTVERVLSCLSENDIKIFNPSNVLNESRLGAADLFCGYLMLDTLISNQDRHHENWAILINDHTQDRYLCPTYDHAASLGRELLEQEKKGRLFSKDINRRIPKFVSKARSELFESEHDSKTLLTIDAFKLALTLRPIYVKTYWFNQLELVTEDKIDNIFERFPTGIISDISVKFAKEMIMENKRRILHHE